MNSIEYLKYIKYKIKYTQIKKQDFDEIINKTPDFCEACVGLKTEPTMKSVNEHLEPLYPENKRPQILFI